MNKKNIKRVIIFVLIVGALAAPLPVNFFCYELLVLIIAALLIRRHW